MLIGTATLILVLGSLWQLPLETVLIGTVLSLSSFGSVLALNALGTALLTTFASGKRLYTLTEENLWYYLTVSLNYRILKVRS